MGLSPQWGLGNWLVRANYPSFKRSDSPQDHHSHKDKAVEAKFAERLASLSAGDISFIIQMAWEDRTAFETIQERMGWSESDVIRLMRHELHPNSFRMWRKRMKGRTTKHRALRSPDMKFDDRLIADHRRGNC
ncbi:TIGR03643 family protein [Limnohabitans sp. DCL3]|uniref:TIGR03643 family protein n=1 Tax=Limnohabitans sp. DCL3 TaxID=3374103 RepID=UPI003A8B642E